jgi:uncharacterized RDD family membrane protein YckC
MNLRKPFYGATSAELPVQGRALLWKRVAAYLVDVAILFCYVLVLAAVGFAVPGAKQFFLTSSTAEFAQFLVLTLPAVVYFVAMEGSSSGATFGKRLLGLRVAGTATLRLPWPATVMRNVLKLLPWELNHAAIWKMRLAHDDQSAIALFSSVWMLLALYFGTSLLRRDGRTTYDLAAGSRVVSISRTELGSGFTIQDT